MMPKYTGTSTYTIFYHIIAEIEQDEFILIAVSFKKSFFKLRHDVTKRFHREETVEPGD